MRSVIDRIVYTVLNFFEFIFIFINFYRFVCRNTIRISTMPTTPSTPM